MEAVAANAERIGASLDRDLMMKVVLTGEALSGKIIRKAKYIPKIILLLLIVFLIFHCDSC